MPCLPAMTGEYWEWKTYHLSIYGDDWGMVRLWQCFTHIRLKTGWFHTHSDDHRCFKHLDPYAVDPKEVVVFSP